MKLTHPRPILVALLLAIGVSAVWWGPRLYHLFRYRSVVTVRQIPRDAPADAGPGRFTARVELVGRWTGALREGTGYYLDSGFVSYRREGSRLTVYKPTGEVSMQREGGETSRLEPPWRWGVTDQIEPTLPDWLLEWAEEEIKRRRGSEVHEAPFGGALGRLAGKGE